MTIEMIHVFASIEAHSFVECIVPVLRR